MAGDAFKKDRHYDARLRKSNNPEDAKRRADRARTNQEFDFGNKLDGYSDKEISMALRGEQFSDEDYFRLTGEKWDAGGDTSAPTADPEPKTTPNPTPKPEPDKKPYIPPAPDEQSIVTGPGFGGGGIAINQNNDINSNVVGDNNTVTNSQDNSIRTFGAYGSADRAKMLRDKYVADVSRYTGA